MEQVLSSENNCRLACQEILDPFWKFEVHYHVHKNLPLDPIMSQNSFNYEVLFNIL
jgi:hypothetical protein